jgi:hypothetical protein
MMREAEKELSTTTDEFLYALKGGLFFHCWGETLSSPKQVVAESRSDFELSSTLHAGTSPESYSQYLAYFVKLHLDLEHVKRLQWYVTKSEHWKCTLTVDFKVTIISYSSQIC